MRGQRRTARLPLVSGTWSCRQGPSRARPSRSASRRSRPARTHRPARPRCAGHREPVPGTRRARPHGPAPQGRPPRGQPALPRSAASRPANPAPTTTTRTPAPTLDPPIRRYPAMARGGTTGGCLRRGSGAGRYRARPSSTGLLTKKFSWARWSAQAVSVTAASGCGPVALRISTSTGPRLPVIAAASPATGPSSDTSYRPVIRVLPGGTRHARGARTVRAGYTVRAWCSGS